MWYVQSARKRRKQTCCWKGRRLREKEEEVSGPWFSMWYNQSVLD
jgi:hypothetical protein